MKFSQRYYSLFDTREEAKAYWDLRKRIVDRMHKLGYLYNDNHEIGEMMAGDRDWPDSMKVALKDLLEELN